jgi:cytochrome d ubiquinol oxidase subunit I
MNSPTGFIWENGAAHSIDPWKAFFNDAWPTQGSHMLLASFEAVGFAVAGVHALLILRGSQDRMHKIALKIAICVGSIAAILQPFNGHWAAQDVAVRQPAKLAAMEAHFKTTKRAGLLIGGIPNETTQEVRYGIHIPGGLSFLAFNDFDAEVQGLDQFPKDEWPPVMIVHFAFQIMVGIGTFLALLAFVSLFAVWRRPSLLYHRRFLQVLVMTLPLGFVAIEAGWIVTEVGRQPWIIYGIMKTHEALTPVPGQIYHLASFGLLYTLIGLSTVWMWSRQVAVAHRQAGPTPELIQWATGSQP